MNDEQLLRYSRQVMLPEIDVAGQEKLLDSTVLVIGAGGLGSAAAMYLAAAGIGHLYIADDDRVELSNLQRQLLHTDADIGSLKALSGKATLETINPGIRVSAFSERLQGELLDELVGKSGLVIDCCDNFDTRFAVNRACVKQRTPLVSGAAIRFEGQLACFNPAAADSPCYNCLYTEGETQDQTCAENGVLSAVVGVIGSLQAAEAIKLLLGIGESLVGRLVLFDALRHEWRTVLLKRDSDCPTCGTRDNF